MNNKYLIFSIAILTLLFLVSCSPNNYVPTELENFASCLSENEVVLYGTFWCPHCTKTKKSFGDSFDKINYVECDPNGDNEQAELCIEKGIEGYPSWDFADGTRLMGEIPFTQLGEKTGCTIPGEE